MSFHGLLSKFSHQIVFLIIIKRRNEVLLSTKSSQIHKPDQPKEPPMPSKNHLTQVAVHSGSSRQQHCVSSESSRKGTNSAGTSHSKSVHKAETVCTYFKVMLLHVIVLKCLAVLKQRITRDDLSAKAVAVLQNLLSSLWRVSHCRKRLRLACTEEHSWRAKVCTHACTQNGCFTVLLYLG